MADMEQQDDIPHPIRQGYRLLRQQRDVKVLEDLHAVEDDGVIVFRFAYEQPVPSPNPEGVPSSVRLRVDVPAMYPFDAPRVYSECKEVQGFPHQDAETGKLCLFDESRSPLDENRLATHIDWTEQWLADAAMGKLLQAGDPYELPDFSRRHQRKQVNAFLPVFTRETPSSWRTWQDRIGQRGTVSFRTLQPFKGIFPAVFRDSDKTIIAEYDVAGPLIDRHGLQVEGAWALVRDLRFHRHRPPQTYGELALVCMQAGLDLDALLWSAWRAARDRVAPCIILMGFPIPEKVGEQEHHVHWQPLFFDGMNRQLEAHRQKRCKHIRVEAVFNRITHEGEFADHKPILWGHVTSIADSSLYARGALPSVLQTSKISICGCGALGSFVAETLARGGVHWLRLFDHDNFEIGNQCRHTLAGRDIGEPKARALAGRLQSCNPLSDIRGYAVRLPMMRKSVSGEDPSFDDLFASDVILDCGMSEEGFQWLSREAKKRGIRLAAMFFNLHAKMLTLCVSGKRVSCYKVLCRLTRDISLGKTSFSYAEYNPEMTHSDKILPESGCWHATFPAVNNHVWMLASAGIEVASRILQELMGDQGRAVIVRRHPLVLDALPSVLTETVWSKLY